VEIKEILTEKNVDFSNLSEKHIKKLKGEWELKKEMAELGIDTSKNEENDEEDGVPLSTRRKRRNANKAPISYRPQKPKYEESDSQNEEDENDDNVKEEEQNEELSDEEDAYEPPSEDEEDEEDDY